MKERRDPLVYLVDDNPPFRRSTVMLLQCAGLTVRDFGSGAHFLAHLEHSAVPRPDVCAVSDIRMPGMSGLELLGELKRRKCDIPVIFITGHADVPLAVEAMRLGAINFIEKPFAGEVLIEAIRRAPFEASGQSRGGGVPPPRQSNSKLSSLTPREHQVLELVVAGKLNKVIADVLSISTKTVEMHRASVMVKLGVRNVPDLVKVFLGYE
jgi:two-component system, LuxR family, response regulator FixJ